MTTGAERQQRFKQNRQAAGRRALHVWLPVTDIDALKRAYPGPRGGIDWPGVIAKALAGQRLPAQALPTNKPEEPYLYWKPNPFGPMDPRCQGTNRNGSRCRSKGQSIIKALAPNRRWGEFNACGRHLENFKPHPSVLG